MAGPQRTDGEKLSTPKGLFQKLDRRMSAYGDNPRRLSLGPHPDPKVERFRVKVRTDDCGVGHADPYAEFFNDDLFAVRCSRCKIKLHMERLNEVKSWKRHRLSPSCRKHGSSIPPITLYTIPITHNSVKKDLLIETPCPGLQSSDDERILSYLQRTSVSGGGSKPRYVLCKNLFGKHVALCDLSPSQMREVQQRERLTYAWINVHSTLSIHAASCLGAIRVLESESQFGNGIRPCLPCEELLSLKVFINAISRPIPDPNNVKFTPHSITSTVVQDIVKWQLGISNLISSVCSLSSFSL